MRPIDENCNYLILPEFGNWGKWNWAIEVGRKAYYYNDLGLCVGKDGEQNCLAESWQIH